MPTSKKPCSPDTRTVEVTWPFRDVPLRKAKLRQGGDCSAEARGHSGIDGKAKGRRHPTAQSPGK
jgi:hypothetical protein